MTHKVSNLRTSSCVIREPDRTGSINSSWGSNVRESDTDCTCTAWCQRGARACICADYGIEEVGKNVSTSDSHITDNNLSTAG
jgi:hypothetical protein